MSEEKARRLADSLQIVLDQFEGSDRENPAIQDHLSVQEARVLRTVGRMHCPIMSAIAGAIRLSLSSATGLVDRLCEKKLVKRDRSPEDRRIVQVELTEQGQRLHAAALEGRVAFAEQMLHGLEPHEQETLIALLKKTSEAVKAKA